MCQKWFVKFCARDFSLDDAPWSGRPVEVDSIEIETVIENNQHYTIPERANILKLYKLIKLLVKMKNVSLILWIKLNGLCGQPHKTWLPNAVLTRKLRQRPGSRSPPLHGLHQQNGRPVPFPCCHVTQSLHLCIYKVRVASTYSPYLIEFTTSVA